MEGVVIIVGDLAAFGRTQVEYDWCLRALHCQKDVAKQESSLTLKDSKWDTASPKVELRDINKPRYCRKPRRVSSLVNYVAKCILNVSTIINDLTKKDTPLMWLNSQKITFDMIKDIITRVPVLIYYDQLKELTLENYTCEYSSYIHPHSIQQTNCILKPSPFRRRTS